jgi:hypothetical protein
VETEAQDIQFNIPELFVDWFLLITGFLYWREVFFFAFFSVINNFPNSLPIQPKLLPNGHIYS